MHNIHAVFEYSIIGYCMELPLFSKSGTKNF